MTFSQNNAETTYLYRTLLAINPKGRRKNLSRILETTYSLEVVPFCKLFGSIFNCVRM